MVLHAHRLLILVALVGFLAAQPEKASGLRSIGFVLRWSEEPRALQKSRHALEDVEVDVNVDMQLAPGPLSFDLKSRHALEDVKFDVNVDVQLAPAPLSFDLNRTSKRRVPRGSDPIHNRC